MYLVSACLAGINCRYDGSNSKNDYVKKLVDDGKAIPVCPEVLGGLNISRPCAEMIVDRNDSKKIITEDGQDVTDEFMEGAKKTLDIAKTIGTKIAILKSKSPSCGHGTVYNGKFSGKLVAGNGVTADLLIKNGIKIFSEKNVKKLEQ